MKFAVVAAIALTLAATSFAHAAAVKESFSKVGKFAATGRLTLENVNGDVTIRTWDRPEIQIDGEKSAKTAEDLKAIELTIDLTDNHAGIRVRLPKRRGWFGQPIDGRVTFTITLPATASVDGVKTVNSSVFADGLRGTAHIETVNGRIHAEHLAGPAVFRTVNGGLKAQFDVVADQSIALHSVNGSVEVAIPADANAKLSASVVNGGINCDFPTEVKGRFVAKSLRGPIGTGAASLNAETVNGSVRIRKL